MILYAEVIYLPLHRAQQDEAWTSVDWLTVEAGNDCMGLRTVMASTHMAHVSASLASDPSRVTTAYSVIKQANHAEPSQWHP